MNAESTRRLGAITGLSLGIGLMYAIGRVGLVPAFILGAGGCVAGSMIAERIAAARNGSARRSRTRGGDD